tara:strand:+ start:905 stop:1282 length:378 start_codon:yes stop_codon:yes gene_type:complete
MTGFLLSLGLSEGLATKLAPWVLRVGIVLAALLALALWHCSEVDRAVKRDRLEANVGQLEKGTRAGERAAGERVANDRTNRQQEQDYANAIETPGVTGDPGVGLACERLRRDGQDTAAIPECGGR